MASDYWPGSSSARLALGRAWTAAEPWRVCAAWSGWGRIESASGSGAEPSNSENRPRPRFRLGIGCAAGVTHRRRIALLAGTLALVGGYEFGAKCGRRRGRLRAAATGMSAGLSSVPPGRPVRAVGQVRRPQGCQGRPAGSQPGGPRPPWLHAPQGRWPNRGSGPRRVAGRRARRRPRRPCPDQPQFWRMADSTFLAIDPSSLGFARGARLACAFAVSGCLPAWAGAAPVYGRRAWASPRRLRGRSPAWGGPVDVNRRPAWSGCAKAPSAQCRRTCHAVRAPATRRRDPPVWPAQATTARQKQQRS